MRVWEQMLNDKDIALVLAESCLEIYWYIIICTHNHVYFAPLRCPGTQGNLEAYAAGPILPYVLRRERWKCMVCTQAFWVGKLTPKACVAGTASDQARSSWEDPNHDDACHLRKSLETSTPRNELAACLAFPFAKYMLDRWHEGRHVDEWCRVNCKPDTEQNQAIFTRVNASRAESWNSKFAYFFLLLMLHTVGRYLGKI